MLLVAYPDRDTETEFEFDYYVAQVEDNLLDTLKNFNFEGKQGQKALHVVIGVAVFLALLLISCIACIIRKNKMTSNNKIEVAGTAQAAPEHELASDEFSNDVDQGAHTDEEQKQKVQVICDNEKQNKNMKDEESL